MAGKRTHHKGTTDMLRYLTEHRPLLTHAQTMRLITKAQSGDERAKNRLVEHNMRLVAKIASEVDRKLNLEHMRFEDLVHEGVFGLVRAIEKFDVTRGNKFSTYATWWVKQSIRRSAHANDRLMRLPVHVSEGGSKLWGLGQELLNSLGREPALEEMREAAEKRWGKREAAKLLDRFGGQSLPPHPFSFDHSAKSNGASTSDDGDSLPPLAERFADAAASGEFDRFINNEELARAFALLSPRTRTVLGYLFGIDGAGGVEDASKLCQRQLRGHLTLEETAQKIGGDLSRERIRQIKLQGLKQLAAIMDDGEGMSREDRLEALDWRTRYRRGSLGRIRERKGIPIVHLASMAGLHKSSITRVDEGFVTTDTFVKICDALQVNPDSLLAPPPDPAEQPPLFANSEAV